MAKSSTMKNSRLLILVAILILASTVTVFAGGSREKIEKEYKIAEELFSQGKYEAAIKALENFIKDAEEQRDLFTTWQISKAWIKIGQSYEKLDQWAPAFNAYQRVSDIYPSNSDAQAGMERNRKKTGQPEVTKIIQLFLNLDTNSMAFSPEGKRIAYTTYQKKNGEKIRSIKIIDTDSNTLKQFPIKSAKDASWFPSSISWSPDGKKIAYTFWRSGAILGEIWVVDSDGTNNRRLVKLDEYASCSGPLNWILNSSKIIFDADTHIYIIGVDGTGRKILKENITESCKTYLSSDGKKIAFQDNYEFEQKSNLWVMDANGQNVKCLTENLKNREHGVFDVSWLSKTNKLIYTYGYIMGTVTFGGDLWLVNYDGTEKKELVKTYDVTSFASSPDGKRIIYVRYFMDEERNQFTHMELWIINNDGSSDIKLGTLLRGENSRIVNTYWSSDGKTIALVTGNGQLILLDLKSGNDPIAH
ncbi:tetratricopeptide repeat protein [bacterium]|nr:tetratricopeptide repeat protein [bacterium]